MPIFEFSFGQSRNQLWAERDPAATELGFGETEYGHSCSVNFVNMRDAHIRFFQLWAYSGQSAYSQKQRNGSAHMPIFPHPNMGKIWAKYRQSGIRFGHRRRSLGSRRVRRTRLNLPKTWAKSAQNLPKAEISYAQNQGGGYVAGVWAD